MGKYRIIKKGDRYYFKEKYMFIWWWYINDFESISQTETFIHELERKKQRNKMKSEVIKQIEY